MLKNKNLITLVALLLLLSAAPMWSADGVAKFTVLKSTFVAGNELAAGVYNVEWTGNPEASVTFETKGKVVATVQGKIVELPKKSDFNSLTLGKDSAGREAIKGLLFSGKSIRIVFE